MTGGQEQERGQGERVMCRAPLCRYYRLSEPGWSDRMLCSHPELLDLYAPFLKAWEVPWTPQMDFGCNRHAPAPAQEGNHE